VAEAAAGSDAPRTRALQRCLADAALRRGTALLEEDPGVFAASWGLPRADQEAFRQFRDRILTYRDHVRSDLADPLENIYPVTRALLEGEDAWEEAVDAFLASRGIRSPFYRDVPPTFLGWLSTSGWGADRWPYLLELAHFEVLHALVEHHPDQAPHWGLRARAALDLRLVPDPSAQGVTYAYAVHRSTPEDPVPSREPTHLLLHRGVRGEVRRQELTPATSALLVLGRERPVGEAVRALGLPDPAAALTLLDALRAEGALLGFRP
jgi:hypothetical protein